MSFNRNLWQKISFFYDKTPPWPCPNCGSAIRLIQGKVSFSQSNDLPNSIRYTSKEECSNFGFIEYRFLGMLVCDDCHLKISSLGYAHSIDVNRHPVTARYYRKAGKVIFPTFFDPPLRLFNVAENCPESIKIQLESSFALYWNDKSSCANKIRTVVELLLDHQNVPKGKGITLHDRILKFKEQNSVFGSLLESAKWIGNIGSHSAQELSKADLLDGFEFMEHVINQLYIDTNKTLERLIKNSEVINQNKGPKPK